MILDQNTIVLNPCNGFYDEFNLVSNVQAGNNGLTVPVSILPGAIVGQKTVEPLYDAKKYPFVTEAEFQAAYTAAVAADAGTPADPTADPPVEAVPSDNGKALEAFYAKYPKLHVITAGFAGEGAATDKDLDAVEILILVENALLGKGIHSLYFPGERTPVYSPVSGDRYLARCVPGRYTEGEPLWLLDYTGGDANRVIKGYYFCNKAYKEANPSVVTSNEIKAFAGEDFVCPAETDENRVPYPFFLDVIDDSTTERPSTINVNGAITNLLRVRMA